MPVRRPGSVTAAAVLAIIYGSLLLLCNLCGAVSLAAQGAGAGNNPFVGNDPKQAELQKKLEDAMQRDVPGYRAMQAVGTIIGLAESLALLIAGIGLLGMNRWARTLALVGCAFAIVTTLLQAAYTMVFVIPVMNDTFQAIIPALAQGAPAKDAELLRFMQTIAVMIAVGTVVVYFVFLVYLLIIVLLLRRRHVRAAFAGERWDDLEARPGRDDLDDEDQGWGQARPPDNPGDDWRYR